MIFHKNLLGMVLAVNLCLPLSLFAAKAHDQACNTCHRSAVNPRAITNTCTLVCHTSFRTAQASNALGSHPSPPAAIDGAETVHFWGGSTTTKLAAGTTNPTTAFYTSRSSISKNRVTCTICHDPHADVDVKPTLLRAATEGDLICQQCHTGFYKDNVNAIETHPVGSTASYAAALLAFPTKYKPAPAAAAPGVVGLVNGVVSCSSCHAPHFADSDSSTSDGLMNVAGLAHGDGHLLKANGPFRADNSLLCQTCHTYKAHGKMSDGGESIGCLTCHSGHIIVGNSNVYVLRNRVTTATFPGEKTITYSAIDTPWNDNTPGTATGYCEVCHGSAETIPKQSGFHLVGMVCRDCHMHQVDGGTYSFQNDANVATCGDCHGFPPYKAIRGDRLGDASAFYAARDGGYAYTNSNHNYALDAVPGGYKSEATTPHNTHAAGGLVQGNAATDYIFGAGVQACDPCHFDLSTQPTHDQVAAPGSYQDLAWNQLATRNGLLSPVYATSGGNAWKCSNTYCHSNGGKRNASGTKVIGDYTIALTPSWALGDNTIIGNAQRCNFCHGNTATTMASTTGNKYNSQSHQKHLGAAGGMGKTYSCTVCHATTADSSTALATTGTNPRLVKDGGTHVNGVVNVSFKSTFNLGNGTLGAGTYTGGAAGTCTTYCHTNGRGVPATPTPDWDLPASGACGTCHGITAATLTTGSHAIHIDGSKAKIKCSSCHGPNTDDGTHGGHVDGAFNTLSKAASCDLCHGVELASGKAWDVSPVWGNPATSDCRTCHTGSVVTSYVNTSSATISVTTVNNLSKPLHESAGHSRTTPYTLTGVPAGNKNCTACHITLVALGTGHVDGIGNSKLLIGGFSCGDCHSSTGSRNTEATVDVQTHGNQTAGYTKKAYNAAFTKTCLACHDPHGTSNGAMIENLRTRQNAKDATGNYAGNVVFSSLTSTNSFDEADSGAGVNNDDLCATCHSTTLHNNRAVAGSHHEGANCTTSCHQHNSSKGGFMAAAGTACNQCHGNPPNTGAHGDGGANAIHAKTAIHTTAEDRTDCAVCHPGADLYTYDPGFDAASGIGEQRNHGAGNRLAKLATSVGYQKDAVTKKWNCATACHLSSTTDGFWYLWDNVAQPTLPAIDRTGVDTTLDCQSCHYWSNSPTSVGNVTVGASEAVSPSHNKHFNSGKACTICHPDNSGDTGGTLIHINDHAAWTLNDTNDGSVLTDRANATQDEATVNVTSWNDGTNTCNNAACHNPSGITKSAIWGTPNSQNCEFCHSSTNPDAGKGTPGSHGPHMNAAGTFGITTIACTSCHPNNAGNNGHLDGSVGLNGFTYSTSLTDYTSSTYGRCTTTICHNNGRGTAVQTPVWGVSSANCTICHNNGSGQSYPTIGRHAKHVGNSTYVPSNCGSCHPNAAPTQITAATHIDGIRNTGISVTSFTSPTCVNTCHLVDATGTWTDANALNCIECHNTGKSAGGLIPTSGLHAGTLPISGNTHDNLFKVTKAEGSPSGTCLTCHSATPSTAHMTGTLAVGEVTVVATVGYLAGATPTCGPNGTLVNCHDDKGAWKRRWSTTATASTGAECANCHGNFDLTWVNGISQRHSSDAQLHGSHDGTDDCYTCHTYKAGSTTYYNIANAPVGQHRDGSIQLNNQMSFIDDGATVHCQGCHTTPLGLANGQYSFQDTMIGSGGLSRWGRALQLGPDANCNACHVSSGYTHADANESGLVHTYHTGSPLTPGCVSCHAESGPGGTNHQNGTVDFGGTYLTTALNYTGAFTNTNCSSANGCHNSELNSWKNDTLGSCGDCHAATGKFLYTAPGLSGWPPTSNEHTSHITSNAYVGSTPTNDCDDCHGTGSSVADHLAAHNDGILNVVIAGSKIAQLNPDKSCTNSCHITANGRDWDSGTSLNCSDCHVAGSYIASAYLPTSGLHAGTLTTSANTHDNLFKTTRAEVAPGTATCVTCHTTSPSSAHINGTYTTTYPTINFAAAVGFADGATPTCGPNAGLVTCHDDDGDWKRKWGTTAKNSDGSECANCHGDFTTGFITGVVARHQTTTSGDADGQVGSSHGGADKCYTCHNYKAGSTLYYNFANKHRDGAIQINSNASFVDNGTTVGCSGCHVANDGINDEQHAFSEASGVAFTRSLEAGPAAGCNSCHGGDYAPANSLNYWPGAAGASAPARAGEHNAHMLKLVAKLGYNMAALTDTQQKEMCTYCHPYTTSVGEGGHGDAAPSEVGAFKRIMNSLADTGTAGSFSGGNGVGGSCAAVDCHNSKTTPATHEWYDGATSACIMCHLDITNTTAGTTGASHAAHTASAATFGKTINCASCHGAATSWAGNTPPATLHIDGTFQVGTGGGSNVPFDYSGTYTDATTRVVGSCGANLCHNNGKNAATPAYTWQTAIAGCAACHATDSTLGSSHTPHMNATFTSTFRPTVAGCAECHDAVSAVSMANKTAHMDGTINLAAGLTYTGTPNSLNVTLATFGSCTGSCHTNGKGAAPATAAAWNTSYANCTICHAMPNTAGNDGARHVKHVNNNTKLPLSCGECHLNSTTITYNSTNHLNATVNTGNKISAHTTGSGTCTNSCHIVNSARGDWLDTAALGCTDCHLAGTYLGSTALPTSGLHAGTLTISANTHDDLFKTTKAEVAPGTATCVTCHTAAPSTAHIDGAYTTSWNAAPPSINLAAAVGFADGATPTCGPNASMVTCHDDDGVWKRKWSTTAKNSNGTECGNCHGDFTTGFITGVVARHQTTTTGDADGQVASSHDGTDKCYTCHNYKAGSTTYYNFAVKHRDGAIQINNQGSFTDNGTTVGCGACHAANNGTADEQHAFTEASGANPKFARSLEEGPSAGCNSCHGVDGAGGFWPIKATDVAGTADDMNQDGQHSVHVLEIAKKLYTTGSPSIAQQNSTCNYCHPGNGHSGDSALSADVSMTDANNDGSADQFTGTKMKRMVSPFANDMGGIWRPTPGTCSNVACHASAPYTPHWYADTVAPANVTLTAVLGPVPRSIRLTWTAPGDDANIDGTAYKYDIRWGTSSATATNFDPSPTATNYVKGVPTVKRQGQPQETIIHGVDPSTTYYFALRTYDGNVISNPATTVYGTSNTAIYTTPAAATLDSQPPVLTGSPQWYGLDSAKALDTSGTVKLAWTRAEDHSMPITYDIWWSTGAINYGVAPSASTRDTSYRVTGLTNGQSYNFAVRAKDAYNNRDTNTITLQAIPQGLNAVPKADTAYYANGTATSNIPMLATVHTTNGTTTTLPAVFIGPTNFTSVTDIITSGFTVNVVNGSAATILRAELIYITGASTPNSFNTATAAQTVLFATDVTVAKRATRLVTFKFNGATRRINAAMAALPVKLGVRVSVSSGAVNSVGWGPTSKGGILSFATQPINTSPTAPTVSGTVSGANVNISWTAATDAADGVGDSVHYDVYGSANGGADGFPHVIATGLTTNATVGAPLVWDTQAAGIALSAAVSNVQVRVEAGDSINGKTLSHAAATSGNLSVNNSGDNVAPGLISYFKAETRPKQGSVYLTWTAPGDDGDNNGRALSYDIRYASAVIDNDTKYNAATPLVSEPYPDYGGYGQGYEVLSLPEGNYFFAIKAIDEGNKTSPLAYTTAQEASGPKCGICHSTPPDETASIGNHAKHGFTMAECGNCHGTEAANFHLDHQDGAIKLGWKTATPATATPHLSGYKYQQNGLDIYVDADGSGGFNPAGDGMDDGSCMSWSNQGVSGCHGPAASANWTANATLVCSSCHGVASRPLDAWGHSFDDPSDDVKSAPPVDNHGYDGTESLEGERKYVGAHIAHLNYSFRLSKGDSCRLCHGPSRPGNSLHADGHIDVKLDLSAAGPDATWTAGLESPLPANRTAGTCASMSADNCHPGLPGNPTGAVKWDSNLSFDCIKCHGMGGTTPSHVTDPNKLVNLADNDPDSGDPMPGNCTWCHVGGHPKEKKVTAITKASPAVVTTETAHNLTTGAKVSIHTQTGMTEINNKTYLVTVINATQFSLQGLNSTAFGTFDYGTWIEGNGTGIILVPNDSRVGINYMSGGIHLKANIGNRGEVGSEAELCWGCHTPNNISEWGADSGQPNVYTRAGFTNNNYNYGTLNQANWVGANWTSGTTGFSYKTQTIRSTHSTDATGTAALTGSAYNYSSGGVDAVGKIRCSNCHDVHNTNKSPLAADGLDPSGAPYLRGTWKSNPYKEDGAPQTGTNYTAATSGQPGFGYGAVPRASTSTSQLMGGYWIDQNSDYPTAGWTYESSAGLCQLCHSKTVDNLDQTTGENLWITATNGHANSALGGSGTGAANIFYHGTGGGRPGSGGASLGQDVANTGVWMGFQINYTDSDDYGYGPRAGRDAYLNPYAAASVKISALLFAWGNAVDAATVEVGYHSFSCSKCHNPHASRLPKLMITNCLDVALNTWDNNYKVDTTDWPRFNGAASSWGRNRISHLSTAQNCHRYIDINNDNTPDEKGWNKVTPWGTNNP